VVQAYISAGYVPDNSIEEFKAGRIRFYEPNYKFNLQTVSLEKDGLPLVNISWRKGADDAMNVIKAYDMDYLMVSMDLKTRVFSDLRGENHRVAHVNKYNHRYMEDAEPSYWYRQFERCPKGYARGIDTRPVAEQYKVWIEQTLALGDKAVASKTRQYKERDKQEAISFVKAAGFTEEQATSLYHLIRSEDNTWEAQAMKHTAILKRIDNWLASVNAEQE
jgi:hypothetical protein